MEAKAAKSGGAVDAQGGRRARRRFVRPLNVQGDARAQRQRLEYRLCRSGASPPVGQLKASRMPIETQRSVESAVARLLGEGGRTRREAEREQAWQRLPPLTAQMQRGEGGAHSRTSTRGSIAKRDVSEADVQIAKERIDERAHLPRLHARG